MMTALSARSFFDSSCLHVLFRNFGSRMSGWFLPSKNCRGSEAIRQAAQPENPNCRLYDQNCITGLFSKLSFFHLFFYELDFDFFIFRIFIFSSLFFHPPFFVFLTCVHVFKFIRRWTGNRQKKSPKPESLFSVSDRKTV